MSTLILLPETLDDYVGADNEVPDGAFRYLRDDEHQHAPWSGGRGGGEGQAIGFELTPIM